MSHYLHTRDKAFFFEASADVKGYAYGSPDDFSRAGVSYAEVDGERAMTTNSKSDILFYILAGEGEFVVGTDRFTVKATDTITVPKNIAFGYFGKMNFVEFMTPAWVEGSDIVSDISPRE